MNYNIFANARIDDVNMRDINSHDIDSADYLIADDNQLMNHQSDISVSVYSNTNMPYGKLPDKMVLDKFEETIVPSEDMLDETYGGYARGVLLDKTPDKPTFASDEPRRGGNMSKNILNLHHNGSRNGSDIPAHPEIFTGFLGADNTDPRGYHNLPNYDNLKKQHQSRMRFVKFGADADNSTTSGSRSDQQIMRDKQTAFKWTKDRLKVFSTEKDVIAYAGPRKYDPKSAVKKSTIESKTVYGAVSDKSFGNNNTVISSKNIVKTKWYQDETAEQDFSVAKLGAEPVNKTILAVENRVKNTVSSQILNDQDVSKIMRVSAALMKDAVMMKKLGIDTDTDYNESNYTALYKQKSEISKVMNVVTQLVLDSKFASQDDTQVSKSLMPVQDQSAVNKVMMNHLTPANHYLNTSVIYKSVMQGKDLQAIKDKVLTDDKSAPEIADKIIDSKQRITDINLNKRNAIIDADGENLEVKKYKSVSERKVTNRVSEFGSGHRYTESNNTVESKHALVQHKQKSASDTITDAKFYDNKSKERNIGVLGSKYNFRAIRRESPMSQLDDF